MYDDTRPIVVVSRGWEEMPGGEWRLRILAKDF
jgi:hypothetical protein